MEKLQSIQGLRAVAANMVVVCHLLTHQSFNYSSFPRAASVQFLGQSGVHCFFIISGYVMIRAAKGNTWRAFFTSRIFRIHPIYWVYLIAAVLFYIVWRKGLPQPGQIVPSLLLLPSTSEQILPVAWSLVYEIYFYGILTLLIATEAPLKLALFVWAIGIAVANLFTVSLWLPRNAIVDIATSPLALEFIAGSFVALFDRTRFAVSSLFAGVFFLIAGCIAFGYLQPSSSWAHIALLGAPYVLIVYGLTGAERSSARHSPSALLSRVGDASYSLYLSHFLLIPVIAQALHRILPIDFVYALAASGVCFIFANIWADLSYRHIEVRLAKIIHQFTSRQAF